MSPAAGRQIGMTKKKKTAPKRTPRETLCECLKVVTELAACHGFEVEPCNICACPIAVEPDERPGQSTCAECEAGIAECERPFEQAHAPS